MADIKIVVIDDQRLFREGLVNLLRNCPGLHLLGWAENGRDFLNLLPGLPSLPDVLLVDMNMPEMNGMELTQIVLQKYPGIKVIILTVYDQERFINKMVQAGAAGYLLKNCDIEEVVTAIQTVHKSGFYFNEAVMNAMRNGLVNKTPQLRNLSNVAIDLTDRELEVLRLICKELTNAEIAEQLYISARTVDGHRNNLLAKTGSRNTAGLVLYAVSHNLIDVSLM